jgi:hypothetical protein
MYSFNQRADTSVVDEPFYAFYLNKTALDHPAREEILKSQTAGYREVVSDVVLGSYQTDQAFFKQMSQHISGEEKGFLLDCGNIILIRKPEEMIASFSNVIHTPVMADLGLKESWEIFEFLRDKGKPPAIIDANELLKNPKIVLEKLCADINIPFDPEMLSWPAGRREEDGVWAKYWYANTHKSTGFMPYQPKSVKLPQRFDKLNSECHYYYDQLVKYAITV